MPDADVGGSWPETLAALRHEVARVTSLMRTVDGGTGGEALGQWNLADVAAHLAQVWIVVPALAKGDMTEIERELGDRDDRPASGLIRELGDLGRFTTALAAADDERDLAVLADRIDARAERYFAACADQDPELRRPWLVEGMTVSPASFAGHLLSENVVHGYDIASAAGRSWRIEPDHARLALERFLFPVMAELDPRALINADNAAGFRARYEIRIRGGNRFRLRFDDGAVHVEPLSDERVDCYISADPVALLLLTWARRGQWSAILRGKLWAWGVKPWLAARLTSLMKNP